MTVPEFVKDRIKQPANKRFIVPDSTPVVCFGDITRAKVITIGINPSSSEFTKLNKGQSVLLTDSERRLHDLKSLGAASTESLTDSQVELVWQACLNYFDGPYYEKWFKPMQQTVLDAFGASYKDRTAAHLDLIQWATNPLWQPMLNEYPEAAKTHLDSDLPFLEAQLETLDLEYIFLSGTPVVDTLKEKFQLENIGKTEAPNKKSQNSLYKGKWREALVLGTSMNVPDSHTSQAHRDYLKKWISENLLSG